jgi:hypothetical protein
MKKINDKDRTREPFKPENTPEPPQKKRPDKKDDQQQNEQPALNLSQQKPPQKDTGRRLGESPLEIDDETTI